MKKEIQAGRMKGFFCDAALEIVKAEGIEAASARTIAERAGYSYATIYNYFDDIDELLSQVSLRFLEECRNFVKEGLSKESTGEKGVYERAGLYTRYFIQYPAVFSLLFCEHIRKKARKPEYQGAIDTLFDSLMDEDIKCQSANFRRYSYAIHGLLMSALNRKETLDYSAFMKDLGKITL